MIRSNLPTHFVPSGEMLRSMIAVAEAKFDLAREACLRDRAEMAFAHNANVIRKDREHDMRRRVFVGDSV
jgi:hypothetical protein